MSPAEMKNAEYIPPVRTLVTAYVLLVALLGATYLLARIPLGAGGLVNDVAAFGIAVAKAAVVVIAFMEFRRNTRLGRMWIFIGAAWFLLMATILSDYYTKSWDFRPRAWSPEARHDQNLGGEAGDGGAPTPTLANGQNEGM